MSEISISEAVVYVSKQMMFMSAVYLFGFFMLLFGFGAAESSLSFSILLILVGSIVILGGVHISIYKTAGDATARVIAHSDIPVYTVPADDESSTKSTGSPANSVSDENTDDESGP